MATTNHTLQETIELAVKLAVQKAKLDMHPIGKTWLTFGDEDPAEIVGGVWERVKTYCLQCSDDDHAAGTVIEAGLPDITGSIHSSDNNYYFAAGIGADGCFTAYNPALTTAKIASETWSGQRDNAFSFAASKSNSIYGKSTTVQPNSIIINVWKRIK